MIRRDDHECPGRRSHDGPERDAAIERRQAAVHLRGQTQQINIRQLPVPGEEGGVKKRGLANRRAVVPEDVMAARAELPEAMDEFDRLRDDRAVGGIREDANESILREGAGGPAAGAMIRQPVVRQLVVNMIGIEQRHEDIHIQQRWMLHS